MEEKIVIDKPVSVEGVQATVINKITLSSKTSRVGTGVFARKQPVAVVIDSLQKRRAFKITGEEVLLEELIIEFPSLTGHL
jgi:hypothetical protein